VTVNVGVTAVRARSKGPKVAETSGVNFIQKNAGAERVPPGPLTLVGPLNDVPRDVSCNRLLPHGGQCLGTLVKSFLPPTKAVRPCQRGAGTYLQLQDDRPAASAPEPEEVGEGATAVQSARLVFRSGHLDPLPCGCGFSMMDSVSLFFLWPRTAPALWWRFCSPELRSITIVTVPLPVRILIRGILPANWGCLSMLVTNSHLSDSIL